MALIPNASNKASKGVNEIYGLVTTGIKSGSLSAVADKYRRDLAVGKDTSGGLYDETKPAQTKEDNTNRFPIDPEKPSDISSPSKTTGSGGNTNNSNDSKIIASIGKGWDDTGDLISSTKKSLSTSKNYIGNLGKVRDQYISALDNYKKKTDDAITGNKTLIEQNQKKDLDTLAGDTRKSMDNTNVMLGIKGASGGSASRAAARAIAESAGKTRAGVLTSYGDETSKQNQAAQNALEEYNTKRSQAYEWEKEARKQALDDYNEQKDALERLSKNKSGWKESDIKALSDRNLNKLLSGISDIQNKAKSFRDNLAAKYMEYGGLADALDVAAVDVDAPAELDTPDFSETIDLTDPNNAEDWFDPQNNQGKKIKVKSRDAAGNPIAYEDAAGNEVDENGDPITA